MKRGSNFKNIKGQRFGRLVVFEEAGRDKQGKVLWKCQCDCGIIKTVYGNNLRRGHTKSCGCLKKERISDANRIDLTGQHFNRLLVLEEAGSNKYGNVLWKCRCSCGTIKIISGADLRSGNTKSCGCLQKEAVSKIHYNSNLTNKERQIRRKYIEYGEWRVAVFERDSFVCQCCGDSKGGNLVAHHFESYTDNPELRTLLENGITLCEECHKNFHHQYGYGNNTREQFEEFFHA